MIRQRPADEQALIGGEDHYRRHQAGNRPGIIGGDDQVISRIRRQGIADDKRTGGGTRNPATFSHIGISAIID